jgi:hypothetical protein
MDTDEAQALLGKYDTRSHPIRLVCLEVYGLTYYLQDHRWAPPLATCSYSIWLNLVSRSLILLLCFAT